MEQIKEPITILIKRVKYEEYQELKARNVLPLIVELTEDEVLNNNAYEKVQNEQLYILKIKFLKFHAFSVKVYSNELDEITFDEELSYPIIRVVEEFECREYENGIVIKTITGPTFYSLKRLTNIANNRVETEKAKETEKTENQNQESLLIVSRIVNFNRYIELREKHMLPFIVELSPYEYRLVSKPFDGLYTKVKEKSNGMITIVLDPFYLKNLVDNKKVELIGIELLNNETHSIDEIIGNIDGNLGGFYIDGDDFLSITEYTKTIYDANKLQNDDSLNTIKLSYYNKD